VSDRPSATPKWIASLRASLTADWSQFKLVAALTLLPAVALGLAWSAWMYDPAGGAMAASGAVAVGFGAFHRLATNRTLPLGFAIFSMAISMLAGAAAHRAGWVADVAVTALWGWIFGLVTTLGWGAWWIGLQGIVALLVLGSIPDSLHATVRDAGLILAGGAIQIVFLQWTWKIVTLPDQPNDRIPKAWWRAIVKNVSLTTAGGRHAMRMMLALGIGAALHHSVALTHGYWVPMTAAILLKPDFHETLSRGVARLGGTLIGAGVATLIAAWLHPGPLALSACLLAAIWGCFSLQRVNYAMYAVCITAYVVFTLALDKQPGPIVALQRIEATLLGAAVALLAHAIPLHRRGRNLVPSPGTPGEG
jgi:hypothetical protein